MASPNRRVHIKSYTISFKYIKYIVFPRTKMQQHVLLTQVMVLSQINGRKSVVHHFRLLLLCPPASSVVIYLLFVT